MLSQGCQEKSLWTGRIPVMAPVPSLVMWMDPSQSSWMGSTPCLHFFYLPGILSVRNHNQGVTSLGSIEGCDGTVTCHRNAPSVKNPLPQLLGGLVTDDRVGRDVLGYKGLLGPRSCLSRVDHTQGLVCVGILAPSHLGSNKTNGGLL